MSVMTGRFTTTAELRPLSATRASASLYPAHSAGMSSTSSTNAANVARLNAARGHGVQQAGQFGFQQHSAAEGEFRGAPSAAADADGEAVRPVDIRAGDVLDMSPVAERYLDRNPEDDDLVGVFRHSYARGPRTVDEVTRGEDGVVVRFAPDRDRGADHWHFSGSQLQDASSDHAPQRVHTGAQSPEERIQRISRVGALARDRSVQRIALQEQVEAIRLEEARLDAATALLRITGGEDGTLRFDSYLDAGGRWIDSDELTLRVNGAASERALTDEEQSILEAEDWALRDHLQQVNVPARLTSFELQVAGDRLSLAGIRADGSLHHVDQWQLPEQQ